MNDGLDIVERVYEKGALLKVLDRKWLDLTTPIGRGIMVFLSSLAEDERERIHRRAAEGRTQARRKGVRFGRKGKLNKVQREEIGRMFTAGRSTREIARIFNVGVATIQRVKDAPTS